jgi:photosystem II stability/assembly factor-like uncharacterized protein
VDWVEAGKTKNQEEGGFSEALHFVTAKDGWMLTQGGAAVRGGIGVIQDGGQHWDRYLRTTTPIS